VAAIANPPRLKGSNSLSQPVQAWLWSRQRWEMLDERLESARSPSRKKRTAEGGAKRKWETDSEFFPFMSCKVSKDSRRDAVTAGRAAIE